MCLQSHGEQIPYHSLVCVGKSCALYQPDAVHCKNVGGSGTDVDWKCEADLPSALRFGRVEVSCEGWNGPGDPYVMRGSCSLEYNLVQIPDAYRDDSSWRPRSFTVPWFRNLDNSGIFFMTVWIIVLAIISYSFLKPFLRRNASSAEATWGNSPPSYPGGPGSYYSNPPPPYTKDASPGDGAQWRPGFWTGTALGVLGNHLLNRSQARPGEYDWEQERRSPFGSSRIRPLSGYDSQDHRREGSSNLGAMRTSTGIWQFEK